MGSTKGGLCLESVGRESSAAKWVIISAVAGAQGCAGLTAFRCWFEGFLPAKADRT